MIYVIVIDAFAPRETEEHEKESLSRICSVIVLVTWQDIIRKAILHVCNILVDSSTV